MDRRKLKKVLAGLGITGLIASTALAGTITTQKKTIPIERIPESGYSNPVEESGLTNATIKLDVGLTKGSIIKFTLTNGNFTGGNDVQICDANGTSLGAGTVSPSPGNNTVEVTLNSDLNPNTSYILSGNATGTDCTGLPISIKGGLNEGDKVSISGEVIFGGSEVLSSADLYEIGKQFSAKAIPTTSKIDPGNLKTFTYGTSSMAILYLENSTVSWPLLTNGTNTIKVSVSSNDWTGVSSVTYCNNTLSNSTDAPKVFSGVIPIDTCALSKTSLLSIQVTGYTDLTPREFKTTVTNGTGEFKRDMEYLKDFVTHKWEYGATTFYIPFVRHNVAQNAFTTIKIQAATSATGSNYTVNAYVLKSDGNWGPVNMPCLVNGTLTSTLPAGNTCMITGDVLTAAAGKEETMVKILITAPEDYVSCYAVYDFQGKSRRVPCKVKEGDIVE